MVSLFKKTAPPAITAPEFEFALRPNSSGQHALYFPSLFISDIHLGTHGSRAKRLCKFLDMTCSDHLTLVGDIIGGTELLDKPTYHFGGPWHKQVLGHFLRKAANGTQVNYIPGNHDYVPRGESIPHPVHGGSVAHRKLTGGRIMGINVHEEMVYTDPKDRHFDVCHGDKFESTPDFAYHIGDRIITGLQNLDVGLQNTFPSLREHSVAAVIKRGFKSVYMPFMSVLKNISNAVNDAHHDGQIYGHSHLGGFERTKTGKVVMNTGCCTEHVNALVHDKNGTWAFLTMFSNRIEGVDEHGRAFTKSWSDLGIANLADGMPIAHDDDFMPQTARLERLIYRAFPSKDRKAQLAHIRSVQDLREVFAHNAENEAENVVNLESLRAAFRRMPIPHPRYQAVPRENYMPEAQKPLDSAAAPC
ncbi:MAG: hypothetical protein WC043_10915 [Pseudobdellovibrionaceae bacterium]